MKKDVAGDVKRAFELANNTTRQEWQRVNQKGFEFSNGHQLSAQDKRQLQEQGMPTFVVDRITPVVSMMNYYATAKNPRWQAIGAEGSDSDTAKVFADLAEYIWELSDGQTVFSNVINDSITKSLGYMLINVDPNLDNGMGEVIIKHIHPFDVYVDPKSTDLLFRDASFVLVRKILPISHLLQMFPEHKAKIKKSNSESYYTSATERAIDGDDASDSYYDDDPSDGVTSDGELDQLATYFERYERVKVAFVNVFYRLEPDKEQLALIQQQVKIKMDQMQKEFSVQLIEQEAQMKAAVKEGKMQPERASLEMEKATRQAQEQLKNFEHEYAQRMQKEMSKIENKVISRKEFLILRKNPDFRKMIVNEINFYANRIKQTKVVGDKVLSEIVFPETITDYPIIPFGFKWTGTPYPMSGVTPLVGKQEEINKSHQIMVHNASLGSSLRWMYEIGSIDLEEWATNITTPGSLNGVNPGAEKPTPITPMPLSNAFYAITTQGKADMEYLAGIYASAQGDTSAQHDTYRGMLAIDEYGTRRIKQWLTTSVNPALRQAGRVVFQFCQAVYSAHKRFRVVQPSALQGEKTSEINIPLYNDYGAAIGKSMDISTLKADIRVVAGSTMPVNRWALLSEYMKLLEAGVIDDIAVLAETDVPNKEQIAKRKSMLAQMQGKIRQMEEELKDKEGTIETLERQAVQAGIKEQIHQAKGEIQRQGFEHKNRKEKEMLQTQAEQKLLRNVMKNDVETKKKKLELDLNNLDRTNKKQ